MNVEYFGERWDVPFLQDAVQVPAPVGEVCVHCDEPIRDGEQGVIRGYVSLLGIQTPEPVHRECDLRMILGGINHLNGDCTCHGGTQPPDPPGVTRRDAARLVLDRSLTPEFQATLG